MKTFSIILFLLFVVKMDNGQDYFSKSWQNLQAKICRGVLEKSASLPGFFVRFSQFFRNNPVFWHFSPEVALDGPGKI
ncbi:MAG: hypothetical protein J6B67_05420 [Oscillospiraceae bacterium]|nr:hypothetical protein [Oscillospiraceae bacterium]